MLTILVLRRVMYKDHAFEGNLDSQKDHVSKKWG